MLIATVHEAAGVVAGLAGSVWLVAAAIAIARVAGERRRARMRRRTFAISPAWQDFMDSLEEI